MLLLPMLSQGPHTQTSPSGRLGGPCAVLTVRHRIEPKSPVPPTLMMPKASEG